MAFRTINKLRCLTNPSHVLANVATKKSSVKPILFMDPSKPRITATLISSRQAHSGNKKNEKDDENKLSPDQLKAIQETLCDFYATKLITQNPVDLHQILCPLCHPNIVLEDRVGMVTDFMKPRIQNYNKYLNYHKFLKVTAQLRFGPLGASVVSSHLYLDDQKIDIHFRFYGLGLIETLMTYLTQMFKTGKNSEIRYYGRVWLEAKSTYYVNDKGLIVSHIVDNRDIDQDRVSDTPISRLMERLKRLHVPRPAFHFKKAKTK